MLHILVGLAMLAYYRSNVRKSTGSVLVMIAICTSLLSMPVSEYMQAYMPVSLVIASVIVGVFTIGGR